MGNRVTSALRSKARTGRRGPGEAGHGDFSRCLPPTHMWPKRTKQKFRVLVAVEDFLELWNYRVTKQEGSDRALRGTWSRELAGSGPLPGSPPCPDQAKQAAGTEPPSSLLLSELHPAGGNSLTPQVLITRATQHSLWPPPCLRAWPWKLFLQPRSLVWGARASLSQAPGEGGGAGFPL